MKLTHSVGQVHELGIYEGSEFDICSTTLVITRPYWIEFKRNKVDWVERVNNAGETP